MAHQRVFSILCLLASVLLSPGRPARADYYAASSYTLSSGSSLAATGALIHSGPCVLGGAVAFNDTASTAYIQIHDRTTQPTSGLAPAWESAQCASESYCAMVSVPGGGIKLVNGAYLVFSTAGTGYTAATASGFYYSVGFR